MDLLKGKFSFHVHISYLLYHAAIFTYRFSISHLDGGEQVKLMGDTYFHLVEDFHLCRVIGTFCS